MKAVTMHTPIMNPTAVANERFLCLRRLLREYTTEKRI
jgi:hypothetical protein